MKNLQSIPFGLCLKRLSMMVIMTLLLAPSVIQAETLNLFYIAESQRVWSGTSQLPKKEVRRRMFMEVDENGDFVIRHGNVSVMLVYYTPDAEERLPDYPHGLQPRVCTASNGMSIKFGFTF